jgi:hypothetical protein
LSSTRTRGLKLTAQTLHSYAHGTLGICLGMVCVLSRGCRKVPGPTSRSLLKSRLVAEKNKRPHGYCPECDYNYGSAVNFRIHQRSTKHKAQAIKMALDLEEEDEGEVNISRGTCPIYIKFTTNSNLNTHKAMSKHRALVEEMRVVEDLGAVIGTPCLVCGTTS